MHLFVGLFLPAGSTVVFKPITLLNNLPLLPKYICTITYFNMFFICFIFPAAQTKRYKLLYIVAYFYLDTVS